MNEKEVYSNRPYTQNGKMITLHKRKNLLDMSRLSLWTKYFDGFIYWTQPNICSLYIYILPPYNGNVNNEITKSVINNLQIDYIACLILSNVL